jgi:hypothetical protein
MTSSTGRCPFPINIRGRVLVSAVHRTALLTGPDTITQHDMVVHMATDRAQLGGGKPRVNVVYHRTQFGRDMMQDLNERAEAKIRNLAAPQGFHPLEIERLQRDMVVLGAQRAGKIPMKRFPYMGHTAMHTSKMSLRFLTIVGAFHFSRQLTIGLGNLSQALFERLRRVMLGLITTGEISLQAKIKACAVTCHGSGDGLRIKETGKVHVQFAKNITLDGHRFDSAFDVSRLRKLVHSGTNAQPIALKQLPTILLQGERFGLDDFAKRRWANLLGGFPGFAVFQVLKEPFIAFVNTLKNVLNGLGTKLLPPGIFLQVSQLSDVGLKLVQREMLLVQAIVSTTERNTVIVNCTTNINHAVQFLRALAAIQLIHECASHIVIVRV